MLAINSFGDAVAAMGSVELVLQSTVSRGITTFVSD